jgi:S1-C subfamily serine protease
MNARLAGTIIAALASASLLSGCIIVVGNRSNGYGSATYVNHPHRRIGVLLEATSPALAAQTGAAQDRSCVITGVLPGTPAAEAGLLPYDVLTHIDGQEDASISSLRRIVSGHKAGETVTLRIIRAGKAIDVTAKVEEVTVPAYDSGGKTPDWRD